MTDLKPWQALLPRNWQFHRTNYFPVAPQPQTPAQDVLLALSKYDPAIEELRQASQLPYSRFPIDYDEDDPCGDFAAASGRVETMRAGSAIARHRPNCKTARRKRHWTM